MYIYCAIYGHSIITEVTIQTIEYQIHTYTTSTFHTFLYRRRGGGMLGKWRFTIPSKIGKTTIDLLKRFSKSTLYFQKKKVWKTDLPENFHQFWDCSKYYSIFAYYQSVRRLGIIFPLSVKRCKFKHPSIRCELI